MDEDIHKAIETAVLQAYEHNKDTVNLSTVVFNKYNLSDRQITPIIDDLRRAGFNLVGIGSSSKKEYALKIRSSISPQGEANTDNENSGWHYV